MVQELFGVEPDIWQAKVLEAFPHQQRIALKASKGVGKTTVEAWLIWNFLLTRPQPCKVAATAISADNLADNLWTELAVWRNKSELLQATFEWTKTRIFSRDYPETKWASARTWPKTADRNQQSQTLAGLHAPYIMFVLDESGGMPTAIMASAEAALSTCSEGHIVQAGNPTHREGPLWDACSGERKLWHVVEINGAPDDPERSKLVDIEWARQQIEKYGRDNPFVLVNVFGQFPPSSMNALIGPDEITDATKRSYRDHDIWASPRVLGIDVSRFGDDASVMWPRQGLVAFAPESWRNVDGIQGAGRVARKWADWDADACFVDDTGGYGASWIDNLRLLGKTPIPVSFSGAANDVRYFNKRSEMHFLAAQWIREGGQLPPMDAPGMKELTAALTRTNYTFRGDRLLLEPKDFVKERLGYSPDHGDAFALTFAQPVAARRASGAPRYQMQVEYDPFAGIMGGPETRRPMGRHLAEYDPFRQ